MAPGGNWRGRATGCTKGYDVVDACLCRHRSDRLGRRSPPDPPVGPRPRRRSRRFQLGRGCGRYDGPGPSRRRPRVRPLLGGRAPQHADHRQHVTGKRGPRPLPGPGDRRRRPHRHPHQTPNCSQCWPGPGGTASSTPETSAPSNGCSAFSIPPTSASPSSRRDRRPDTSHYVRTLTARATTRPITTSDTVACTAIADLAHGTSGITSVGLNAVLLVNPRYK
jgi:hypothetical protein